MEVTPALEIPGKKVNGEAHSLAPPYNDSTLNIKDDIKTALQNHRAAAQYHRNEQTLNEVATKRLEAALEELGESSGLSFKDSRCEALRNYLIDHPGDIVTTKMLRAAPSKYGIITSSPKLQLNWLYGKNNPTARRFFKVANGIILLRPGITRETLPCA
jgi:hypothetical protein